MTAILSLTLAPPNRDKRPGRIFQRFAHDIDFFFHEKPAYAGMYLAIPSSRHGHGGRSKSIIDVDIRKIRQLFGKSGIVVLFFIIKSNVLQQIIWPSLRLFTCFSTSGPMQSLAISTPD
jgi:hypothetical protein